MFHVTYQIKSFYLKNVMNYANDDSITERNLRARIRELVLEKFRNLDLDTKLLNKKVFTSINSLYLDGELISI